METKTNKTNKIKVIGLGALGIGLTLLIIQYFGLIRAEVTYLLRDKKTNREVVISEASPSKADASIIAAKDKDFALIIPRLNINVKVIPDVSPFDSKEYQKALSRGVAHAEGTGTPPERRNTVLFAHSTDNFYNANRYNAIFYLLYKLRKGDSVYLVHNERLYKYAVRENTVVEPSSMEFMEQTSDDRVTLITCWPPGTTLRRRVVVAERL